MASELLVDSLLSDGKQIVDRLIKDGFEVTVAFWVKSAEVGSWHLYIASPQVEAEGPGKAYLALYTSLSKVPEPWVELSDVKLIGSSHPVAREARGIVDRHPAEVPTHYRRPRLGGLPIEEAYIYPPPAPLRGWPRLSFRVSYQRQGASQRWRATAEPGPLYREIRVKGVISYSTSWWGEEKPGPEDEKHATVSVLLEIAPEIDDEQVLELPEVRRMLTRQARDLADDEFRSRHPEAVIEHDDPDE